MVALSVAAKEVMFLTQLLGSMKMSVKLPVMVRVDNVGALFIASNITTTAHVNHFDIRYNYVNESVEDGVVKIIFLSLLKMTTTFSQRI